MCSACGIQSWLFDQAKIYSLSKSSWLLSWARKSDKTLSIRFLKKNYNAWYRKSNFDSLIQLWKVNMSFTGQERFELLYENRYGASLITAHWKNELLALVLPLPVTELAFTRVGNINGYMYICQNPAPGDPYTKSLCLMPLGKFSVTIT